MHGMHSVNEVYPGEYICHENRSLAVAHYRDAGHYAEKYYKNIYFLYLGTSMKCFLCDPNCAYDGLQASIYHIEEEILAGQKVMCSHQC